MPATKIDPNAIADELGVDPLRYFVLREYTLGADGDFTYEALFQRYESDLGNDLGNLLNRTISMAHKFVGGKVDGLATPTRPRSTPSKQEASRRAWEEFAPVAALLQAAGRSFAKATATSTSRSPGRSRSRPSDAARAARRARAVCCETLRWAALMVAPAMPAAAREILRQLGREQDEGTWPDKWGWPGGDADRTEAGLPAHRARTPGGADRRSGRRPGAPGAARRRPRPPRPPPPSRAPPTSPTTTSRSWICAPPR